MAEERGGARAPGRAEEPGGARATVRPVRGAAGPRPDADFPADPYPGLAPPFSFVHLDGLSHPLDLEDGWSGGGATVGGGDLDAWLAARDAPPLAARVPLLSYGSNRNPGKISWLRRALGLAGPVVVLRARTDGLAAVWASGFRARDGQRTSVLAAAPGVTERHALWLATPDQVAVLDRCEGRGDRHRLARLATGAVQADGGLPVDAPWCYLGLSAARRPLLVDGRPVRCATLDQAAALRLDGVPAPGDGLAADTVEGTPHPDEWPAAVFVYGSLRPGGSAWPLLAGHAVGPPRPAHVAGRVADTVAGYPALLPGGRARVHGDLLTVRDPVALLRRLDDYEGPGYQRVRVAATTAGNPQVTACWTYTWVGEESALRSVPAPPED